MSALKDQFAGCLHLPADTAASRPTFYFSLTNAGTVVARPRIVLYGFKGTADARARTLDLAEKALRACLPVKLAPDLAATISGKVYYLQYVEDQQGRTTQVLFRPFGSHGGGGYAPLEIERPNEGFVPPSPVFVPRPPPFRPAVAPRLGNIPTRPYIFLRRLRQAPPARR